MKIFASVDINGPKWTQAWEFIEGDEPFLVLIMNESHDIIGIPLERSKISALSGHEIAQFVYSDVLNLSAAEIVSGASQNPIGKTTK